MPRVALAHVDARFSAEYRTAIARNLLHGARHAVLTTLYSRAHRIGLDGVSCLLDGFGKSVSFDFFVIAMICVLVSPALEIVILAEQKLEGFGDHVGRRSINELGIEF